MARHTLHSRAALLALAAAIVWAGTGRIAESAAAAVEGAVEWGGTVHTSPESLAAWLSARGASYELWAERHPEAAARLGGEGGPPESPQAEAEEEAGEAQDPGAELPESNAVAPAAESGSFSPSLALIMIVAAVLLGLALIGVGTFFSSSLALAVASWEIAPWLRRRSFELVGTGVVLLLAGAIGYAVTLL